MSQDKHVVVLMGGWSAERDVSLKSGEAVTGALLAQGYKVTPIDMKPDLPAAQLIEQIVKVKPDVVFNALHGKFGEDGCVQGLLELLKVSYTHSGVRASSVAMDKPMAKRLFESVGLRCPKGRVVSKEEMFKGDPMPRPYVVKPSNEGSSVGVQLIQADTNFNFTPQNWAYSASVLVEEYIAGQEITVAVLNDKALGVTEIKPKVGFYDYENKYTDGKSTHLCPAPLEEKAYDEVMELALRAHKVLGCRGLSRADFRYDGKTFYLLEVNTQPGMTSLSLSPEIAAYAGINFEMLVKELVEGATYGEA